MTTFATRVNAATDGTVSPIAAQVARIQRYLDSFLASEEEHRHPDPVSLGVSPLDEAAELFNLTAFERDLLMLCAAVELDGGVAAAVCQALESTDPRPTLGLAMACIPDAHWDALVPEAPLRSWQLINLSEAETLTTRKARIDERLLHYLLGLSGLDRRLDGTVVPLSSEPSLFRSHEQTATRLAETLLGQTHPTSMNLQASDESTALAIAAKVADLVGAEPVEVVASALPGPGSELHDRTRLIDREWILARRIPVVTGVESNPTSVAGVMRTSLVPLMFTVNATADHLQAAVPRLTLHEPIAPPSPAEQRELLQLVLGESTSEELTSVIEDVSHRHRLNSDTITAIGAEMSRSLSLGAAPNQLNDLFLERSRTQLDNLAQRISSKSAWEDIVLPSGHLDMLREITRQVKHRTRVYDEWGFADRITRGLGVTALFAGESGTGKTLAAEIIANELSLDLYRVDLASTVSKYIGETEKNLARLFDAAESSGAVLLFDEADALFGKRTEVRDSHDRYANLEVAYLLQRMESYRGLAILTTNLRSNLDRAFARRLRFIIQFPFPDEPQREEIWRRTFPPSTPLDGVDPASLARLTIPGGSIWSIALAAAFAAADDGSAITPAHLLQAARIEYAKTDRALTPTETAALR